MNETRNRRKEEKRKKERKKKSGFWAMFPIILLFLLGMLVMLYPSISNYVNQKNQNDVIVSYDESVAQMNQQKVEAALEAAREYNRGLLQGEAVLTDPFDPSVLVREDEKYMSVLAETDMMAYLEIPAIKVHLPIYHGTLEDTLRKAVGHLQGSSLPVGGEGTHSVLSAHNGLPTSKLFTDLDQLKEGDVFYVKVLTETLKYRVDKISVVEPSDTSPLMIDRDADYVTLITCTPYGVNSHRLLVRGVRTEGDPERESSDSTVSLVERDHSSDGYRTLRWALYGVGALVGLAFVVILFWNRKGR